MISKRYFYYMECEEQEKLFKYLDEAVDEGYIIYLVDIPNSIIVIENLVLEDNDELFRKLDKMDAIEDRGYIEEDEDYDDFYDNDDYEE